MRNDKEKLKRVETDRYVFTLVKVEPQYLTVKGTSKMNELTRMKLATDVNARVRYEHQELPTVPSQLERQTTLGFTVKPGVKKPSNQMVSHDQKC